VNAKYFREVSTTRRQRWCQFNHHYFIVFTSNKLTTFRYSLVRLRCLNPGLRLVRFSWACSAVAGRFKTCPSWSSAAFCRFNMLVGCL